VTHRQHTTNGRIGSGAPLAQSLRPRGPVQLELTRENRAGATVIAVAGELDLLTASRFGAFINELVHRGRDDIVVDLTDTQFMDSAGLHILLSAHRRMARGGRGLSVICPHSPVRRIIEMARLTETLGVFSSFGEYQASRPAAGAV
jgi:anti-sigma B factor antagonist